MVFEVVVPDVEELAAGTARELVVENALRKARAVVGERVLGADTCVSLGARVYGKPGNEGQARAFLEELSGVEHEVWSAIALIEAGVERTTARRTRVRLRALDRPLIDWYLGSGEWRGRAGGYAIQGRGAALVEGIDGDYSNVVGLPIPDLLAFAPDLFGVR